MVVIITGSQSNDDDKHSGLWNMQPVVGAHVRYAVFVLKMSPLDCGNF